MSSLPDDFLELPRKEQRRLIVEQHAERFENGHPDAWLDLLLYAVDADPDIPEPTKVNLRARLLLTLQGAGKIDPREPEYRKGEWEDLLIYSEVMQAADTFAAATKAVAEHRGVSVSTIRRAYERHLKLWPNCRRLDGRRKQKTGASVKLRR